MSIRYVEVVKGSSDARYPQARINALASAFYCDSNNSYKLTYDQNGTRVTMLDDQGSGLARMPVINSKVYNMGLVAGGGAQTAVSLFKVATVTLTGFAGGSLYYTLTVTDGTDVQALTGMVTYAAVDKAGTVTAQITEVTANQAKAVSTGTVTIAWSATTATDLVTFKAAVTTSLSPTTDSLVFTLVPMTGTVVTL